MGLLIQQEFNIMTAQGLACIGILLINIVISRWLTIILIEEGFIKRDSPEFRKAVLFWFVPVMGALGLWFLLLTKKLIQLWKWITLSHHKPQVINIDPQEDFNRWEKELLDRVEIIKEQERLASKKKRRKN